MRKKQNRRRCWGRTTIWRRCGRYGNWRFFCHDHKWQWAKFLGYVIFTVIAGTASIYGGYHLLFPTSSMSGVLIPDNAPTPSHGCSIIPDDSIIFFLGNSAAYQKHFFPSNIISMAGKSLLSIDKTERGYFVSAKIFSLDGRIIAEIQNNKFYINPNSYFRIENPNKHTLIVYDQKAEKVLDIYFINHNAVKILGIFGLQGRKPVIIEEDRQSIGSRTFSDICIGGAIKNIISIP